MEKHAFRCMLLCILFLGRLPFDTSAQVLTDVSDQFIYQQRIGKGLVFDIIQDSQGVMWLATGNGLVRYDGTNLRHYQNIPGDSTSIAGNVVHCLFQEEQGAIWAGTHHTGLSIFDPYSETFTNYQYDAGSSGSLSSNYVNSIVKDEQGSIWIGTRAGGFNLFEPVSGSFTRYQTQDQKAPSNNINHFFRDADHVIWAATDRGLFNFQPGNKPDQPSKAIRTLPGKGPVVTRSLVDEKGNLWIGTKAHGAFISSEPYEEIRPVDLPVSVSSAEKDYIWDLYQDSNGNVWIATGGGLFFVPFAEKEIQPCKLAPIKRALSLFESTDGVLWVGTDAGAVVLSPRQKKIHFVSGKVEGEPPVKRGITSFAQAPEAQIWVGTTGGLFQFERKGKKLHQDFLSRFPELTYFKSASIQTLFKDSRGDLWISIVLGFNRGFGLFQYRNLDNAIVDYSNKIPFSASHVSSCITEDTMGNILIANDNGLIKLLPDREKWQVYQKSLTDQNSLPSNHLREVWNAADGTSWIGTSDAGLLRWKDGELIQRFESLSGKNIASGKRVRAIMGDHHQRIWVASSGGLDQYDGSGNRVQQFKKTNGLPENEVLNLLEDASGQIWLTTRHYMATIAPNTDSIRVYDNRDGIILNEFWDKTAFKDKEGFLYFGGDEGIIYFHPNEILHNDFKPKVILTDLLLFNQSQKPNTEKSLLTKAVSYNQTVRLAPEQKVISLHFSALSYINPFRNTYAYRLDGFDKNWQYIGHRTETTYTNLSPGNYTLQIKAANNDGVWGPVNNALQLRVFPPWYKSWWAYLLYFIFFAGLAITLYRFQMHWYLERAEKRRLVEMGDFKNKFYTGITHEFRTPLTVILGMNDQMKEDPEQWLEKGSQLIEKNGRQLLNLINQMLELSKLETQSLPINWVYGDLSAFIRYLTESFASYAAGKSIGLYFSPESEAVVMDYDQEKIQLIMSNLISNAIKNTPEKGRVQIEVKLAKPKTIQMVSIAVKDSGRGIPAEILPHIFDRFFQYYPDAVGKEGTGIGLSITKQLVELLGGKILVESELNKGSTFRVYLPVHQTAQKRQLSNRNDLLPGVPVQEINSFIPSPKGVPGQNEVPSILIIEDSMDLCTYLAGILGSDYHLSFAHDGYEGRKMALNLIPDLIVSDVMMPKLDGFQLCQQLKENFVTSHIPLILLTAKSDLSSRVKGLKHKADAYLSKPFHKTELQASIDNLLASRRQLQAYYLDERSHSQDLLSGSVHREHGFVKKVRQLIEENLDRSSYSIEQLAKDLHVTTNQLYRKMKALTGVSTSKFYRSIQIDFAKALLVEKELTISEIAYRVGFSDPAYFSRAFTESTGKSPSEFRESLP